MIKNNKFMFLGVIASFVFGVAFVLSPTFVEAYSPITGSTTLRVGSKGENVRILQQLLASDSNIYPSGAQDGSFGPLTKNAVIQFQIAYSLGADGIVGPATRSKVNSVVAEGRGIDVSAPQIYNLSVVPSGRNVSVSLSSSEAVKGTVFFDTIPINWNNWNDAVMSLAVPAISGTQNTDSTFSLNKQFNLNNLSANTVYYYTLTITDQSGNISVIVPRTFTTGQ